MGNCESAFGYDIPFVEGPVTHERLVASVKMMNVGEALRLWLMFLRDVTHALFVGSRIRFVHWRTWCFCRADVLSKVCHVCFSLTSKFVRPPHPNLSCVLSFHVFDAAGGFFGASLNCTLLAFVCLCVCAWLAFLSYACECSGSNGLQVIGLYMLCTSALHVSWLSVHVSWSVSHSESSQCGNAIISGRFGKNIVPRDCFRS